MSDVMVTWGMKLFLGALGKSDGRVLPISSLRDLLKAWSSLGAMSQRDEPTMLVVGWYDKRWAALYW